MHIGVDELGQICCYVLGDKDAGTLDIDTSMSRVFAEVTENAICVLVPMTSVNGML